MKITVNRAAMLAAYQTVSQACSTKGIISALASVKCKVVGNGCTLMATDNEIGIRLEMRSLNVHREGECLLPSKVANILKESDSEEMTLDFSDNKLHVKASRGRWEMPTEDVHAFPEPEEFGDVGYHEVLADHLRDAVRKTEFVPSAVVKGYGATTGVLVEYGDKFSLVTTDGSCLSRVENVCEQVNQESGQVVLTVAALQLIARSVDDGEKVKFHFSKTGCMAKTDTVTISSRLVEGTFPKYQNFIPKESTFKTVLLAKDFLSTLRQASIFTNETSKRLTFAFSKDSLSISEIGRAHV